MKFQPVEIKQHLGGEGAGLTLRPPRGMLVGTRMESSSSAARRFRELLARPGIIRSLGAHDVFSALLMEQAGFNKP